MTRNRDVTYPAVGDVSLWSGSVVAARCRKGFVSSVAFGSSLGRQPALDGMRGVAVALVFFFHVVPDTITGGWVGVDMFFVLSGFLITRLLLVEIHAEGRVDLRRFWTRRARRLVPPVVVVLGVYVAAIAALQQQGHNVDLRSSARTGAAVLLYLQNWAHLWSGELDKAIGHLWSLSVEEQFYLVWPLVIVGFGRSGSPRRLAVVTGIIIAAGAMTPVVFDLEPRRLYFGSEIRAAELLVGALLAQWHLNGARHHAILRSGFSRAAAVWIFAVLVAQSVLIEWRSTGFLRHHGFMLFAVGTAFIIAAVLSDRRGPLARALSWGPLVALGLRSYSLYLVHHPIERALQHLGLSVPAHLAVVIVCSAVATEALHRLVELRTMTSPKRMNPNPVPSSQLRSNPA
ncbi:MAG: acyltransferase family protein [Acidimicrobiia bacterium]